MNQLSRFLASKLISIGRSSNKLGGTIVVERVVTRLYERTHARMLWAGQVERKRCGSVERKLRAETSRVNGRFSDYAPRNLERR